MNRLMTKIRNKPIVFFAFVTVLGVLLIGLNVLAILWVDRQAGVIVKQGETLIEIEEAQIFLLAEDAAAQEYLLTGEQTYLVRHKEYETLADFHLNQAQRFQTAAAEQDLLDEIRRQRDAYLVNFARVTTLYERGEVAEATTLALTVGDTAIQDVHEQVELYVAAATTTLTAEVAQIDTLKRLFLVLDAVFFVLFIGLTVFAFWVGNRVLRPIILLAIFITLTVIGWDGYNLWRLDGEVNQVVNEIEVAAAIEEVELFMLEQEIITLEYLLTGDEVYLAQHDEVQNLILFYLQQAADKPTLPEEADLLRAINQNQADYALLFQGVVATYQAGNAAEAIQMVTQEGGPIMDDTQSRLDSFITNGELRFAAQLAHVHIVTREALTVGIFTLVIFAVEAVISITVTAQVLTPVMLLIAAAESIAEEKYDTTMLEPVAQRSDDIGHLARTFQHMSQTVHQRTHHLKQQVQQLRIQIDEAQSLGQVKEILASDFFRGLETGAEQMRAKRLNRRQEREQKQKPT